MPRTTEDGADASSGQAKLLLICGWPACGKSYFGDWLETHRGFRHLDLDDCRDEDLELRAQWERDASDDALHFAAALLRRHTRWVITWGAPAGCLPRLESLRRAGFTGWFFFPGSELHSRLEWLRKAREMDAEITAREWKRRADEIRRDARDLRRFFRDHCIETMNEQGARLACETLAERVGALPDDGDSAAGRSDRTSGQTTP